MFNLKRPLNYLVPFETMDADKRGTENNDVIVGIPPVEITPTRHIRQTAAMTLMMIVTSEYDYRVLEMGSV